MNILLAGGAGFIGTRLALMAQRGGHEVTVVDDGSGATDFNVRTLTLSDVLVAHQSIRDYLNCQSLKGYDAIINLACRKMVACADPADAFDVNTVQAGLLAAAAAKAGVPRYIHISTGSVYGDALQHDYVRETDVPDPNGLYAVSKLAGEHITGHAIGATDPSGYLTILRLFNVMGPGQAYGTTGGVLARWCAAVAGLDTPPELNTFPWTKRQVTDVADVARAILLMITERHLWDVPVLNIASGVQVELQTLWGAVREASGTDQFLSTIAPRDGVFRVQCCNQLSRDLGMIYNENWQELVRSTVQFYKELANASH